MQEIVSTILRLFRLDSKWSKKVGDNVLPTYPTGTSGQVGTSFTITRHFTAVPVVVVALPVLRRLRRIRWSFPLN